MITLIVGKKGSGKTKKLIQLVDEAVKASKGNVVCIEKGAMMTYDISHDVRLINIEEYNVNGYDALYGYIAGICGGNYDVTDIFVDTTRKIVGEDLAPLACFVKKLNELATFSNTTITLSLSAAVEEIPAEIHDIVKEI